MLPVHQDFTTKKIKQVVKSETCETKKGYIHWNEHLQGMSVNGQIHCALNDQFVYFFCDIYIC